MFPNGNWVNNKMYYNSQKAAYLPLSEEPITEEEIAKIVGRWTGIPQEYNN